MWICPKPELAQRRHAGLLDKMAVNYAHRTTTVESLRDYMMFPGRVGEARHRVVVHPGFDREGGMSTCRGEPMQYEAGEESFSEKKSIVPGLRGVVIGDRGISTYSSFPGWMDSVRIHHGVIGIKPSRRTD